MTQHFPHQTANDFHPEVLKLFDQYVHGSLSRRGFLSSASKFAVGAVSAEALLQALSPNFAQAQQVKVDDARINTAYAEYPSPNGNGTMRAYIAKPSNAKGPLPVILVIHENRGLNPHIEDIARRLALDNFIAIAPDALFPLGGYPGTEDKARELFPKLDQSKTREDFLTAAAIAKTLAGSNGKVGAVGFCYGGAIANFLATRISDLGAAVAFYGGAPNLADVGKIKAQVLVHHAGKDERLVAAWPKYEEALKAAGTNYQGFIYDGVEHGFNNDTTPRFDATAASLAWSRTLEVFNRTLRS
jgi:carboxymethylenebutenolidase